MIENKLETEVKRQYSPIEPKGLSFPNPYRKILKSIIKEEDENLEKSILKRLAFMASLPLSGIYTRYRENNIKKEMAIDTNKKFEPTKWESRETFLYWSVDIAKISLYCSLYADISKYLI